LRRGALLVVVVDVEVLGLEDLEVEGLVADLVATEVLRGGGGGRQGGETERERDRRHQRSRGSEGHGCGSGCKAPKRGVFGASGAAVPGGWMHAGPPAARGSAGSGASGAPDASRTRARARPWVSGGARRAAQPQHDPE